MLLNHTVKVAVQLRMILANQDNEALAEPICDAEKRHFLTDLISYKESIFFFPRKTFFL